jgi:hypothetical protein
MEPITITTVATAIATVIFNKAIEKGGENLGQEVSNKIGQLLHLIRDKFQQEGVEGKLLKAQDDPSEKNQDKFKRELAELMEDDQDFANKLKMLINEIQSDEKANTIFFKGMKIKGSAKLGNIDLKSKGGNMEAVTDSEIGEDFTMGDVNMTNG